MTKIPLPPLPPKKTGWKRRINLRNRISFNKQKKLYLVAITIFQPRLKYRPYTAPAQCQKDLDYKGSGGKKNKLRVRMLKFVCDGSALLRILPR